MTTSMFGTPLGQRTYDEDQAKLAQHAAQTRLANAQADHQGELTNLNRAQSSVMLRKMDLEDKKLAILASGSGGDDGPQTLEDLASLFTQQAGNLARAGYVSDAQKLADKAAAVLQKGAATKASEALVASREAQVQIKKIDRLQEILAGVRDPQTHAAALLAMRQDPLLAEEKVPPALERFNPEAIRAFLSGSKALKTQIETQSTARRADAYVADQGSKAGHRSVMQRVAEAKLDIAKARETRLEKAGAGGKDSGIGRVTGGDLKGMKTELKAAGFEAESETAELQAQTLAERALALTKRNPGITMTEARTRVIEESKAAGELAEVAGWRKLFGGKAGFTAKPGQLTSPLALPDSAAKLKDGSYYRGSDGSVRLFKGGKWAKTLPPAKVPDRVPASLADDDEDEED